MGKEYVLFSDCIIVNGCKKCAIYDLSRGKIFFIPDTLYEILEENNGFPYSCLKLLYPDEHDVINEYLDFLLSKELILKVDFDVKFEKISHYYETPYIIDNIIIDIDCFSNHNFQKIKTEIDYLGCPYILLRFYSKIEAEYLLDLLSVFENTKTRDITVIIPYKPLFTKVIKRNIWKIRMVSEIVLHSAPYNNNSTFEELQFIYTTKKIVDETYCGIINLNNFSLNLKMYLDSRNYNNCLHKKISIDRFGNIKNCPSSSKIFGIHYRDSLIDIVDKDGFKDLWYIKKDDIESCSICIYRYMCLDCRIYRSDELNIFSKPKKCKYNVYEENSENNLCD